MVTVVLSNYKNIACWINEIDTYIIVADDTIMFSKMLLNVFYDNMIIYLFIYLLNLKTE